MIFQHFLHKMYGVTNMTCHKKIKGQPTTIIWINLVDLESLMLYTNIQPQALVLEKIFKCFDHIWAWRQSCLLFKQIVNTLSTEGCMWNVVKITLAISEKTFKNYTILYMYIGRKADNPQGKKQIISKKFYYFNHTLQISVISL